jgi:uncharacterized protein YqeY
MSLEEKINADIKTAMLAKEKEKLEALRAIKSAVLLAKTAGGAVSEINEAEENKLLQKLVKQRKDAAEIYVSQSRKDMADVELFQASIIEKYLPQQLSEEEIKSELQKIISETGVTSAKEMGKVMGLATQRLAGRADGKIISQLLKTLLS